MIQIADHIEFADPIEGDGQFYKGWRNDKQVSAIQVFPFQLSEDEVSFFNKQVTALNGAITGDHAAIPRILSWGFTKTDGFPFIEMEWTEGYKLTELKQHKEVTIDEIGTVAEQVSRVLTYCHNLGVVHGNLSGKYILWDEKKECYVLTGFRFGMEPPVTREAESQSTLQQKDIYASQVAVPLFESVAERMLIHDKIIS